MKIILIGLTILLFCSLTLAAEPSDCDLAVEKYYEMSSEQLKKNKRTKKTKVEKKVYKSIASEMKRLDKYKEPSIFSVDVDDFSEEAKYRTSWQTQNTHKKTTCDGSSVIPGKVRFYTQKKSFFRQNCQDQTCGIAQLYFLHEYDQSNYSSNDMASYFGINKAVVKGLGEIDVVKIDYDSVSIQRNGKTYNTAQFAISLSEDQLEKLHKREEDIAVKIYSLKGKDLIRTVSYDQLKVFYEGLLKAKVT